MRRGKSVREDSELKRMSNRGELIMIGTHSCWDGCGGPEALQGTEDIYRNLIWSNLI